VTGTGPGRRPVAAFDFDGTITRRDTLTGFLATAAGRARTAWVLARHLPLLAGAATGRTDRDAGKERILAALLGGRAVDEISEVAARYASALLDRRPFRAEVLDRLAWHRDAGHRLVVVSASLHDYVAPVVRALGVTDVLASRLEVGADGRVTGRLAGGNLRGARKADALRALLGPDPVELWAYGNSAGDRDLLALADHPVRV